MNSETKTLGQMIVEMGEHRADVLAGKVTWGRWSYQPGNRVLFFKNDGGQWYEVDLDRIHDAASALDWIVQVNGKSYIGKEDVGYLVEALDDLLALQSNCCGGAILGQPGIPINTRRLLDGPDSGPADA